VGDFAEPVILKVLEQPVRGHRGNPAGPLWQARPETANRLRGRIENVLDWAKARGARAGDNPASWDVIGNVIPARLDISAVEHFPALPYAEIPEFMAQLRARKGGVARALEFTVICAVRTGDTVGCRWSEIDLAGKVWTVPAGRAKTRKEFRVPLSDRTIEILKSLPRDNGDVVFSGPRRLGLHATAMNVFLKRVMGRADLTVHGFRSSFRDFCGERTNYAHDVAEAALSHIKGKVERAYQRGDLFNKRRRLMADWARYCASPPKKATADVVPIRK
jgi:integrase